MSELYIPPEKPCAVCLLTAFQKARYSVCITCYQLTGIIPVFASVLVIVVVVLLLTGLVLIIGDEKQGRDGAASGMANG